MKSRHLSEIIAEKTKRFASAIANKADISLIQELLFGLLFIKCASECKDREHGLEVPNECRWSYLKGKADSPSCVGIISNAMKDFENSNESLKGLLTMDCSKALSSPGLVDDTLEFIDSLPVSALHSMDLFGRVYECLHTGTGGRKNGHFFTPDCVAKLLVEMLLPSGGKIYDPCCGTGSMFVHVVNFVKSRHGCLKDIAVYGQESSPILHRICRINLALRGIDNSNIKWNSEGTLLKDACPGLKADFVLANPPFNDTNWGWEKLKENPLWKCGTQLPRNANFIWLLHSISHLSTGGMAGVILPNGSLSSGNSSEVIIRKGLVESGIVKCIVGLPDRLFLNTSISACVWILKNP